MTNTNNYIVTLSDKDKTTLKTSGALTQTLTFNNGIEVELTFEKINGENRCEISLYNNFCKIFNSIEWGVSVMKNKVINYFNETYCVIVA